MSRQVSLRHLRCFVEVARTGSFTVAASHLFVTQSSLTATIQQFEEAVGLKLFDRTTRRVLLTQVAGRFKVEAERILRDFDNAISDLKAHARGQDGHIRVVAAASVIYQFLVPAMATFRADHPNVTVSLRDAGAAQVERMVVDGEVDFAIASKHRGLEDQLDYIPVLRDHYGVVCRADLPLGRGRKALHWEDLPAEGYVAFSPDTGIGAFLRENAGQFPFLQGTHDEISSTTSLYAVLNAWNRYSILPALAASAAGFGNFRFRGLADPVLSREICLITRRLRTLSPGSRRLLKVLLSTIEAQKLPPGVSPVPRDASRP
jgi:DNA-binding transcriptional LysR family regulator